MMKIALVHMRHSNVGGTELFLNQLSKYLCEQGEDVTIICRTHVEPSHPNIKFVQLKPFSLGKAHRVYQFAKAVEKHVKNTHYDVVYGLGKTWSHDLIRIGGGTRKHVVELRKDKKPSWRDRVSLYIERRSVQADHCKKIVSNSNKTSEELIDDYGVDPNKIVTIHNAVETKRFDRERLKPEVDDLNQKLKLEPHIPTFLFLGSGYNRKGLKDLLDAFKLIEFKSNLLIVGNENHPEEYIEYAKKLGVYESCHFLGKQSKPEVFFALADCYILPTKYEPFGFTVIEALSCGTPTITTQDCGAKEVIDSSVSTVLSQGYASQELAEAMSHWASLRDNLELKQQCRESIMKQDVEVVMAENYDVIMSLVSSSKLRKA